MRKQLLTLFLASLVPAAAFAEESIPPLNSPRRILWAMQCAGPMPTLLVSSLLVICALAIASVVYYKKAGGRDEEE